MDKSVARSTEPFDSFSFSPRDLEFIVKFSEENGSDVFRQILHSICPSIYGHELIKGLYNSWHEFFCYYVVVYFITLS